MIIIRKFCRNFRPEFFIRMSAENPLLIRFSRFISDFFNPIISQLIFFGFFAYLKMGFEEAFNNFLLIVFVVAIPIFGWIYWNVKRGKYTNMDVSDRNQRKSLYFFALIILLVYTAILYFTDQNRELLLIIIFNIVLMVVLQLSNYFIKSSMHTSANVFVSMLFFSINATYGGLWFLIAIMVGLTRIILKRHTPKEVFAGAGIALIISLLYLYIHIQKSIY